VTRAATLLVPALLLSACAVGPDYKGPPPPPEQAAAVFDRSSVAPVDASAPVADWWKVLGDAQLDQLVVDAFAANKDLAAATANLRAARAVLRERHANFLPSGDGSGGYQRQRLATTTNPFIVDRNTDLFTTGFDAVWEIDLFGRLSRSAQEARALVGQRTAEREGVLVSIAAEVADAYVQLRGAQVRLQVARDNAANQQESFNLTEALDRGGRGTALDIARAGAQLQTTLSSIPPLEADVDVAIARLSVLTGRAPSALRDRLVTPEPLPTLPDITSIGAPADLLRRRPDIRAAERALAGASARIGVATADLFPTVSIGGSASTTALTAGSFLTAPSIAFAIGPQLIWNFLDWPRIRARIAQADAAADGYAAQYEQTVLTALEETENALSRYGKERERARSLAIAAGQAGEAARLANLRYRNGIDNFINVLDAERVKLESDDRLAVSRIETARQFVAVYKALGGGWENAPPPKLTK
jgi:multidrug efflux system outer membrane protein